MKELKQFDYLLKKSKQISLKKFQGKRFRDFLTIGANHIVGHGLDADLMNCYICIYDDFGNVVSSDCGSIKLQDKEIFLIFDTHNSEIFVCINAKDGFEYFKVMESVSYIIFFETLGIDGKNNYIGGFTWCADDDFSFGKITSDPETADCILALINISLENLDEGKNEIENAS